MSVLYRKYRPQKFGEIAGQEHIKTTIVNEIAQDNLAHAYLFVGPRGTGKTTIARLMARSINCQNRKADTHEPCNNCQACEQILAEKYLDVFEIDAATHTQVDNVRDTIISSVAIPPIVSGGYKVFIIDEIHMLSRHAFNALLKTIEEPPSKVVFILATTKVNKVPDTIISRCQRFDFRKIPYQQLFDRLKMICQAEKIKVPDNILSNIAHQSQGCARDAESLLDQVISLAEKGKVSDEMAEMVIPKRMWEHVNSLLHHLHQKDSAGALQFINDRVREGFDTEAFFNDLIEYLRLTLLQLSIGANFKPDLDDQTAKTIAANANNFTINELIKLINIFSHQAEQLRYTSIPHLPLELGSVSFCEAYREQNIIADPPKTSAKEDLPKKKSSQTPPAQTDNYPGIKTLKGKWSSIVASLKDYNHSLAVFLKVAHPITIEGNRVVIGFKFDFHADTVSQSKNKAKAEEAISSVLNTPVIIDCVVDDQYSDNHKKFNGAEDPEVKNVLDIMGGGEVV